MSLAYPTLVIGGVEIPTRALYPDQFRQEFSTRGGVGEMAMDDGSLVLYQLELRDGRDYFLETTISGGGHLPAPLWGLNPGTPVEVQCAEWLAVTHATDPTIPVITVPFAFRSGGIYGPKGYALVEQGGMTELVETPLDSLVGRVATLTAVPGAMQYQLRTYPVFTGRLVHSGGGSPLAGGDRRWAVTLREV